MSTNESGRYTLYGEGIRQEVCDLRHSIGRNCRDCEYEKTCDTEEVKEWRRKWQERVEVIKKGSVLSE